MTTLLFALLLAAQQYGVRIDVHAIDISASVRDDKGNVPRDLRPEDFVLLEDGKPQRIIGAAYANAPETTARRRQLVIYVQQSLATTDGLRSAMTALAAQAERLTSAGEVEVATDFPHPHSLVGPTRDANVLRSLLQRLAAESKGEEEIIRIRQAYVMSGRAEEIFRTIVRKEWLTLRTRQDEMLVFLGRYPRHDDGDVRTLLLITDGYDVDPMTFYEVPRTADPRVHARPLAERNLLRELSSVTHQTEVAQSLAAQGWTILSLAMAARTSRVTNFKETERSERGPTSIDVLNLTERRRLNASPLRPLAQFSDATAGGLLTDPAGLASQLDAIDQRVIITYQVDRASDDRIRTIEVRAARPGITVHAQKFAATGTSAAIGDATASALATAIASSGAGGSGDLKVTCSLESGADKRGIRDSKLNVHVGVGDDPQSLRVIVAVVAPGEAPFTTTRLIEPVDLTPDGDWASTIDLRHRDKARIAILAAEPATGAWGACTLP